jgi:tetratricopeptide (TPR) repeat protein
MENTLIIGFFHANSVMVGEREKLGLILVAVNVFRNHRRGCCRGIVLLSSCALLLFFAPDLAAQGVQNDASAVEEILHRAFGLHQAGQYAEALALLQQAHKLQPRDYFINLLMGIDLLRTGKNAEAIPFLNVAAKQKPGEEFAYEYLGEAQASLRDFAAAASAYARAVTAAPDSVDAVMAYANFNLARFATIASELRRTHEGLSYSYRLQALGGGTREASKVGLLRRAASLSEDAPGIWSELAIAEINSEFQNEALDSLQRALQKNPGDLRAWQAEAMLAAQTGDWKKAAKKIEEIGKLSPNALLATREDWPVEMVVPAGTPLGPRAEMFFQCLAKSERDCTPERFRRELLPAERKNGASPAALFREQRWESVVALPPPANKDAEAWSQRGIALARTGLCRKAIPALEHGLRGNSHAFESRYFLSVCYARETGSVTEKVQQAAGDDAAIHLMRGDVLLRLRGDPTGATVEYHAAHAKDANNPAAWERLAEAQLAAGQEDSAHASAQAALRLDPRRISARRTLAKLAMQQRDYANALPYLRQLAEQDPRDVTTKIELATACAQIGDSEEAWRNLAPALEYGYPDEKGRLHYLLGTVYRRLGKAEEAEKAFAEARKLSQEFQRTSHEEQDAKP